MSASASRLPLVKPPVVQPGSGNSIIVNPCQRMNRILEYIRNVSKEFGDIVPDYQLGKTTCAFFLSLKYHRLHPEYIHQRVELLGSSYTLRILLVLCDIDQHQEPIRELTKMCLINNITVIMAWSEEEAGQYLATYKQFEHRPPDLIKERVDKDYHSMFKSALTSISRVNKMDVETLRTTFGSFAKIASANPEKLQKLSGFGPVKVRKMQDAFEKPFRNNATSKLTDVDMPPMSQPPPAQTQLVGPGQHHAASSATGGTGPQPLLNVGPMPLFFDAPAQAEDGRDEPEKTPEVQERPQPQPPQHEARSSSPAWGPELELDEADLAFLQESEMAAAARLRGRDDSPNLDEEGPPPLTGSLSRAPVVASEESEYVREGSPVWDIELDLND